MVYLTELADVLRAGGCRVVEVPGWKTRGHGGMVDVRTITCHHTAGLNDMHVVRDGRPGLDGPLAQLWLSREGVYYVVAAGRCWHAGDSRDPSYTSSHAVGIEAEATGVDAWPDVQMVAYRRGAKALADHYQVPYARVLGHKETCAPPGRKSDPNFDMDAFRASLTQTPVPKEWDEMATKQEIVDAVLRADVIPSPIASNPTVTLITAADLLMKWALAGRNAAQQSAKDAAEALAITRAMAAKGSALSPAELAKVTAAAKAGAAAALDAEINSATVTLNVTPGA